MKNSHSATWKARSTDSDINGKLLRHSATYMRFLDLTKEVRDRFPDVRALTEEKRLELYELLEQLDSPAQIKTFPAGSSSIHMYDCTQGLTECHYGRTFLRLLKEREFSTGKDRIAPGRTTLAEVSTGSAGIAFGYLAKTLGFDCKIVRPQQMELPRALLMEEAIQHNEDRGIHGEVIPAKYPGWLKGAVQTFREMVQTDEARAERKEGTLALPNHSQVPSTIESCRETARDACRLLLRQGIDPRCINTLVMAAGNGTSILGFSREFREHNPNIGLQTFEGEYAPNLALRLLSPFTNHPLPPEERKNPSRTDYWAQRKDDFAFIDLYGADGTQGMEFPAIDQLVKEDAITWNSIVKRKEWLTEQQHLNKFKPRNEAFGRTTAAAMHIATEEGNDGSNRNILTIAYDLRDRYDQFVTNPDAECDESGNFAQEDCRLFVHCSKNIR